AGAARRARALCPAAPRPPGGRAGTLSTHLRSSGRPPALRRRPPASLGDPGRGATSREPARPCLLGSAREELADLADELIDLEWLRAARGAAGREENVARDRLLGPRDQAQ